MSYMPLAFWPLRRPPRRMMAITSVVVVFSGLSGALLVFGQQITIRSAVPELSHIKLTNGFFVTWGHNSPNIEVFDRNGSSVARIDVLASFPEFQEVGIYDASVQPDRALVVAAVVVNRQKKEVQAKGTLSYYDWHGSLMQAVDVEPSIERLEVDEDGKVWALLNGARDAGPAKTPVIAVFKGDRIIKSFLNWTYFPHHAYVIEEGAKANGAPAFGITPERVWFWLPGYDVFSFDRDGGNLTRIAMKLPKPKGALPGFAHYYGALVNAFEWIRIPDGRFIFFVSSRAVNVEGGLYILSKKGMVRYPIVDSDDTLRKSALLGLDNSDLVFALYEPSRNEFQIFRKHLE